MAGCDPDKPEAETASGVTAGASASAAPDAAARDGTLVTYQHGKEIGRERFRDDGAALTSEIKLGPGEVTVTLPRGAGEVVVIRGGKRETRALEAGAVALENGSWQAYAIAADRFASATTPQAVKVLLPSLDKVVDGTIAVTKRGDDRVVEVVIAGLVVRAVVSPVGVVTSAEVPAQALLVLPEGETPPDPAAERPAPDFVLAEPYELARPDAVLKGELWRPRAEGAVPIMILVAGSGPTDRDGNNRAGLSTDTYRLIAAALAERGVASLRYDKRGIGKSTTQIGEKDLTMQTFADDVAAIVRGVRADARFSKVLLAGHSEGGELALMAAASERVDGLALVASPGRTTEAILREQLSTKLDAATMKDVERILTGMRAGRDVTDIPDSLAGLFRPSIQPFLRSQLGLDPPKMLAKLEVPRVVILQGAHDAQIRETDARALAAARPDAKLVILPKANHVLKDEPSAELPQKSYADPSLPLSAGVLDALMHLVTP